tara:strand:+ start:128 stop:670 length:543 start_codon:yes stop_codon:yes gene_type:complete
MKSNKLDKKILELNVIIDFIESNILDPLLQKRYILVLRHQKALIRDVDRKGRKIPENIPFVCEMTGFEVNSIREKEPPFKLIDNIKLTNSNGEHLHYLTNQVFNTDVSHNSYSHMLNNYSIKSIKKLLGRKIEFNDLSSVSENITLIIEALKHRDYYKKYICIDSLIKEIDKITLVVDSM